MKYSKQQLWKDKIRYLLKDGKIYFYVQDIKMKYPLTFVPFDKMLKIESIYVTQSKNIEEMRGFDRFHGIATTKNNNK